MYRLEEIEVRSVKTGLKRVRENIGKWAHVELTNDNRVKLCALQEKCIFGVQYTSQDIIGYLPEKTSCAVLKGLKAGKKIKARVFDFVPKFEDTLPTYNVSIWMN